MHCLASVEEGGRGGRNAATSLMAEGPVVPETQVSVDTLQVVMNPTGLTCWWIQDLVENQSAFLNEFCHFPLFLQSDVGGKTLQ